MEVLWEGWADSCMILTFTVMYDEEKINKSYVSDNEMIVSRHHWVDAQEVGYLHLSSLQIIH